MSEVATFVDVSQFEGGESAYECVAICGAQLELMGPPGESPRGTAEQVDQMADQWYAREEGSFAASNTNGMSLDAEYVMLHGLGLSYIPLPISAQSTRDSDIANVKAMLARGYPVLICGAETGFYDDGLGDVVPYGWPPSGNHAIIASGIAPSGNLLVHDMANVGKAFPPGSTREYDVSKMYLISGTAIVPDWSNDMAVSMADPTIQAYYEEVSGNCLKNRANGCVMGSGITAYYLKCGGVGVLRLNKTGEIAIDAQKYPGVVYVRMEACIIVWDPGHIYDDPPTHEPCYLMHTDEGLGQELIAGAVVQQSQVYAAALTQIATTTKQALGA